MTRLATLTGIDSLIAQAWREIADLRKQIDEKTAHVDRLIAQGLHPYFADDLPTKEWVAIGQRLASIGSLEEAKRMEACRRSRGRS